ncbi:hypothetical protein NDU88_003838, partial [Pleurodeles waltl]
PLQIHMPCTSRHPAPGPECHKPPLPEEVPPSHETEGLLPPRLHRAWAPTPSQIVFPAEGEVGVVYAS